MNKILNGNSRLWSANCCHSNDFHIFSSVQFLKITTSPELANLHLHDQKDLIRLVGGVLQWSYTLYYFIISEFFVQIRGWCDDYKEGMFVLWLGPSVPFVVLYRPDYVEVTSGSN